MLINLYGYVVNPDHITSVSISLNGDYLIHSTGVINYGGQDPKILEIKAERVAEVDELGYHDPKVLYMKNMINALSGIYNGQERQTES